MERSTNVSARTARVLAFLVAVAFTGACNRSPAAGATGAAQAQPSSAGAPGQEAAALTLKGDRSTGARAEGAAGAITGTVAERLDVPNYTYLRLTHAGGETWAAVPTSSVAVGAPVTVVNGMPMTDFFSKTLGRTFARILFGTLASAPSGASASADAPANPHAQASGAAGATGAASLESIAVAKATGPEGRTVAELYAQRNALAGGTSAVRGRVVKVTSGVLGRTWLHLRDGTGDDAAKTNDLVVSTSGEARVGDELTARGTVRVDHDLGAGYVYALLLEDATLTRP